MSKCPICGCDTIGKIPPSEGATDFFICTVNQNDNPPSINAASGMPVQLFGCTSCGSIFMQNQKLINQQLRHE